MLEMMTEMMMHAMMPEMMMLEMMPNMMMHEMMILKMLPEMMMLEMILGDRDVRDDDIPRMMMMLIKLSMTYSFTN